MDAAMVQGGLEVNYQNRDDDEEAELEREELERQNEVSIVFQQRILCWCQSLFKCYFRHYIFIAPLMVCI